MESKKTRQPQGYPISAEYLKNIQALEIVRQEAADQKAHKRELAERGQKERVHSGATLLFGVAVAALLPQISLIWLVPFLGMVGTGIGITWHSLAITRSDKWWAIPESSDVVEGLAAGYTPERFIEGLINVYHEANTGNNEIIFDKESRFVRLLRMTHAQMGFSIIYVIAAGVTLSLGDALPEWAQELSVSAVSSLWNGGLFW